jgi:cytoskeletal protein RodZ
MENNNLKQWFDAAKNAEPIVSVQEVGAMINTPSPRTRVKPTFKTYFIMAISLIVMGGLAWWLNLTPDASTTRPAKTEQQAIAAKQKQNSNEDQQVQQPAEFHQKHKTATPSLAGDTGTKSIASVPVFEMNLNSIESGNTSSPPAPKFNFNGPPLTDEDGRIRLTYDELARLGIETDGHMLRYLSQTDTSKLNINFKKVPEVYAFDIEIKASGSSWVSNTVNDDSVLHNRSVKVMPLFIGVKYVDKPEFNYWLQLKDVPNEYKYTYIESIKNDLVPLLVETTPISGATEKPNTLIFWYASTEAFRNRLPVHLASEIKQRFPEFDEMAHRKLIQSFVDIRKENDEKYFISRALHDELWESRIELTQSELKKIGIGFNGKKIEFRKVGIKPDGGYIVIDLKITPDIYSLNTRNKIIKGKPTKLSPWCTSDTSMVPKMYNYIDGITNDFIGHAVELQDLEKTFVNMLDSMVPVYIKFDEKAVKNHSGEASMHFQLFWFPLSPAFIEALPERYRQPLATRNARIDFKKVNVIEMPDSLYDKLGLNAEIGSIKIPLMLGKKEEPVMATYSLNGSSMSIATLSKKEFYALPREERGDSVKITMGNAGLDQLYMYHRKPLRQYPAPVLITNGNGTNWYMNDYRGKQYELNDSDLAYMRAHQVNLKDYPKYRQRDEAAKAERLNTLSSLIPIHIYAKRVTEKEKPFDLIAWYEPTPELLAVLPEQIGGQIGREYEAIKKDEQAPSCKYFEVCKNIKGKISSSIVYPNPVAEELKIGVELEEERKLTISVADISGRIIKVIAQQQLQGKGIVEYTAGMKEMREGIYLISIETDKGERVVQRIIKK